MEYIMMHPRHYANLTLVHDKSLETLELRQSIGCINKFGVFS